MAERAGEANQGTGKAMKRRGILAAAGAVVAGIVAKQAAQPVAAAVSGGTNGTAMIIGANTFPGNTANLASEPTILRNTSGGAVGYGASGPDAFIALAPSGYAVKGYSTFVSVYGECSGSASTKGVQGVHGAAGYGVLGQSASYVGVQGEITTNAANAIAVKGYNPSTGGGGIGVSGQCDVASGIGVVGASSAGVGVKGAATSGFPVVGQVVGPASINAGVLGVGILGPGVQGQSTGGHGLVGTTAATDGQHAGLIGTVQPGGNGVGLRGSIPAGATGFAGVFDGDLIVNGALRVYGSPKNAAVKHPDNTHRLLYCEESPESWFADYGEGTLVNGRADIRLDPDFAALVHTEKYHVFLTEYEGHSGLYVTGKGPAGFTVAADVAASAGGPKAPTKAGGGTFSYRVVAKRKDIAGERLAKVAPPPALKPVTPFTVPETPEAKPPATKP